MARRRGAQRFALPLLLFTAACGGSADEQVSAVRPSALHVAAAVKLGSYHADLHETSVSGISSGGYMAVQFHVAYSSIIRGVGVFAGGPYHCSGSSGGTATALTTCMQGTPGPDVGSLTAITESRAAAGDLDPVANLRSHKVWLFSGTNDNTVHRPVMDALQKYYQHFVPTGSIVYKSDLNAAHAHITPDYGNGCSTSSSPYINNCGYDAEAALLQQIYGTLEARNSGTLSGRLIQFDQSEFLPSPTSRGMDNTGWVYVPASCASREPCKVHVALHGCEQSASQVGDAYYAHAGYNQWADTNHIIVLYPQTVPTLLSPNNPKGCWDWWGYNDGASYDTKRGPQLAAIRQMVDRLTGVAAPPPPPATCFTDSNWNHFVAGRAAWCFGFFACAAGSNQNLGLLNILTVTTLKQTAPGYFTVGTCP